MVKVLEFAHKVFGSDQLSEIVKPYLTVSSAQNNPVQTKLQIQAKPNPLQTSASSVHVKLDSIKKSVVDSLAAQIQDLKVQIKHLVVQKASDSGKHIKDIFDQLEIQLSDSQDGLLKGLNEVTAMIKAQENEYLAKIDSLQADLNKKLNVHHNET